jgi:uncharacterized repeat protein (TIGR01451 family)
MLVGVSLRNDVRINLILKNFMLNKALMITRPNNITQWLGFFLSSKHKQNDRPSTNRGHRLNWAKVLWSCELLRHPAHRCLWFIFSSFSLSMALAGGPGWLPSSPNPPTTQEGISNFSTLTWVTGAENLLKNGGFEVGLDRWTTETNGGVVWTWNTNRSSSAWPQTLLGQSSALATLPRMGLAGEGGIFQDVTIPSRATSAVISWIDWSDDLWVVSGRELRLEVRDLRNRVLATPFISARAAKTALNPRRISADVTAFIGQTVRLAFVASLPWRNSYVQLDDIRLVTAPIPGVDFEVYLGRGGFPLTATNLIGRTRDLRWTGLELLPNAYYRWQVVVVRGNERFEQPFWYFKTAAAGAYTFLQVKPLPTPVVKGLAVPVEIVARDANGFDPTLSPNVGSVVQMAGLAHNRTESTLLFTEIIYNQTNEFECMNVADHQVDISDWQILYYDGNSANKPRVVFRLPKGTVVPPGGIFLLRSGFKAPGEYPWFNAGQTFSWTGEIVGPLPRIAIAIVDANTNLIDFVNLGRTINDITSPVPIGGEDWIGAPVGHRKGTFDSIQRVGNQDHQDLSDWVSTRPTPGQANEGLDVPFGLGPARLALSPQTMTNSVKGVWRGSVVFEEASDDVLLTVRDFKQCFGQSTPFQVKALPLIRCELPTTILEGGPAGVGTLRLPQSNTVDVVISLVSRPEGRINLPSSVVIPAGSTETNFSVSAVDNMACEGPLRVTVGGTATGFEVIDGSSLLLDDETVALTLQVPPEIREGSTVQANLTLSAPVSTPIEVSFISTDETIVFPPRKVLVSAGQTNVAIELIAPEDYDLTGSSTISIAAQVLGWPTATATLIAADNDLPKLNLSIITGLAEGQGARTNAGIVTLSGRVPHDVMVKLSVSDPSEISVPDQLIVPAGTTNAFFVVTVADDAERDGIQTVIVRASADGFPDADATLTVADNDLHHFDFALSTDTKFEGNPFPVTITARDVNGESIPVFTGTVNLSAQSGQTVIPVAPSATTAFTQSAWSGAITIGFAGESIHLIADGSDCHTESEAFRVLPNPVRTNLDLMVDDMIFDPTRQVLVASVAETDPRYPNRVLFINPTNGAIQSELPVGQLKHGFQTGNPEEGRIALSSDGRVLYIATRTNNVVEQYDLATRTLVREIPLGVGSAGEGLILTDMQVALGDPQRLFVAQSVGPGEWSLCVYQNGLLLPQRGPSSTIIMLSPDGVYGYSVFMGQRVFLFESAPQGVVRSWEQSGISGWWGGEAHLLDDGIYSASGLLTQPGIFGSYQVSGMARQDQYKGSLEFSADGQRIWFVSSDGGTGQLLDLCERSSFQVLRSVDLTSIPGTVGRLRRCGLDRLALHNYVGVYLLQSSVFTPTGEPADLSLARTAAPNLALAGKPFTYTLTVTNLGSSIATDVILDDYLPENVDYIGAVASQGEVVLNWKDLRAVFGDLKPFTTATMQVTLRPRAGGEFTSSFKTAANEWDPVAGNNYGNASTPVHMDLAADDFKKISLVSQSLAVDWKRDLLFVSVGSNGGGRANRVVALNAKTGEIAFTYDIGVEPSYMAVTDDGRYLYTVIETNRVVVRVELDTGKRDLKFRLPELDGGSYLQAQGLWIIPGHPDSLAILQREITPLFGSNPGGIGIYDLGVPRSDMGRNLRFVTTTQFGFSPDLSVIYGASGHSGTIERFSVSSNGVTMTDFHENVFGSSSISVSLDFDPKRQWFYASDGKIIDPISLRILNIISNQPANQLITVHPTADRVCFLEKAGGQAVLKVVDQNGLQVLGQLQIDSIDDYLDTLVPLPEDRLAFRLLNGSVFLVRSSLLAPTVVDADGDRMPDAWELANGLDARQPDSQLDLDGDGVTNGDEYIAGTRPNDPTSAPRISASIQPSGLLGIRIFSLTGRNYCLERKMSIEDQWISISDPREGDGGILTFEESYQNTSDRFYRVRIWLPQ